CDPLFLFVGHFSYRIVAGQLFHYVCDAEARRLLARWKFLECLEQRSNSRLRRDESEHSIGEPLRIKDGRVLVGSLEWVAPQVEELGHAQRDERFHPDAKTMRALLQEMNLPLLVAQGHQIAIVTPIEEHFPWVLLRLTFQERQQIKTVDVDLEGLVARLMSLLELLNDVGFSRYRRKRGQHVRV